MFVSLFRLLGTANSSHSQQAQSIRLYSVWTKVNDWIYLVHFTCDIFEFYRHQRVALRLLNSLKLVVPRAKTVLFTSYFDEQLRFAMKFPTAFEQVFPTALKKKSSGTVSPVNPRLNPLVFARDRFIGPSQEDFRRFITVVVRRRRKRSGMDQNVISDEIDSLLALLPEMLVSQVELSWINVSTTRFRVLEFRSDSIVAGSWYRQVIAVREEPPTPPPPPGPISDIQNAQAILSMSQEFPEGAPGPVVSIEEQEVPYTIVVLTMQANCPRDDEFTNTLFSMTEQSMRLFAPAAGVQDNFPKWYQWEHVLLGFGLYYDPEAYVCKDAGVPFAEALFVHRDDILGTTMADDSTTYANKLAFELTAPTDFWYI